MRALIFAVPVCALIAGCALTPEQAAEHARSKSNAELCIATIRFPQYGDAIANELEQRHHTCDWGLTAAQVHEQDAANARRLALIQAATAPTNTESTYQIVRPISLPVTSSLQIPSLQSSGVTAFWTGKQQQVQTVTYQSGWNCEYNYAGRTFWRTFVGTCPQSVQVQ